MKFCEVARAISSRRLGLDSDPVHDSYNCPSPAKVTTVNIPLGNSRSRNFLKDFFYHCGIGAIFVRILLISSRRCRQKFLWIFKRWNVDFGADPAIDPDPWIILTEFLPLRDRDNTGILRDQLPWLRFAAYTRGRFQRGRGRGPPVKFLAPPVASQKSSR